MTPERFLVPTDFSPDADEALRVVASSLDAYYGTVHHTDSLLAALQAVQEADDFEDFVAELRPLAETPSEA